MIRVANNYHLAGAPARLLRELPWVEYSEGTPTENCARLRLGEVEMAIIPVVDYLELPQLASLPFGMGCRQRSESMLLYATSPINELETIHIYECSRTSLTLLQILLHDKWRANPRIVRQPRHYLKDLVDERSGILHMHDLPGTGLFDFPVREDLATAWFDATRLPFLFLIWAFHPDCISADQLKEIVRLMHLGDRNKARIAAHFAPEYGVDPVVAQRFVGENRRYYLDDFLMSGFKRFSERAAALGLVGNGANLSLREVKEFSIPLLGRNARTYPSLRNLYV